MERPTLLQVRCSCQPTKLLGYLPIATSRVLEGARVKFGLGPPKARAWSNGLAEANVRWSTDPVESEFPIVLELEVVRYGHDGFWRLAFKGEHTTVAMLRRIEGFVEAS